MAGNGLNIDETLSDEEHYCQKLDCNICVYQSSHESLNKNQKCPKNEHMNLNTNCNHSEHKDEAKTSNSSADSTIYQNAFEELPVGFSSEIGAQLKKDNNSTNDIIIAQSELINATNVIHFKGDMSEIRHIVEKTPTAKIRNPDENMTYTTIAARLNTFQKYPQKMSQSVYESLAIAGFFHLSEEIKICCFDCRLIFRDWNESEDPFEKHSIHSPNCDYMRQLNPQTDLQYLFKLVKSIKNICIFDLGNDVTEIMIKGYVLENFNIELEAVSIENGFGILVLNEKDLNKRENIVNSLNGKTFPKSVSSNLLYIISFKENEEDSKEKKSFIQEENMCTRLGEKQEANMEFVKNEIDRMKKERACVLCEVQLRVVILLPCAHLSVCAVCCECLEMCPICKLKVEATVKTYC